MTIEASPTILAKQRLFVTGDIVTSGGNRVYRAQAYERGIEWAKQWIDNNYRYGARVLRRIEEPE